MRLTTWNCHHGSMENCIEELEPISSDILVLQECQRPQYERPNFLWFGENPKKGLGVFAKAPYILRAMTQAESVPRYVIPIEVSGRAKFTLFAVWTLNDKPHQYIRGLANAVEAYEDLFTSGPTVVMGDFNSNSIWDRDHPAELNHSSVVQRLERLKLVSAYHFIRGEEQGSERDKTYYHHWNAEKGFHIDYCFVPQSWQSRITTVHVGSFNDQKDRSDHRPLTVELID